MLHAEISETVYDAIALRASHPTSTRTLLFDRNCYSDCGCHDATEPTLRCAVGGNLEWAESESRMTGGGESADH
jgi:hypothetical protein